MVINIIRMNDPVKNNIWLIGTNGKLQGGAPPVMDYSPIN